VVRSESAGVSENSSHSCEKYRATTNKRDTHFLTMTDTNQDEQDVEVEFPVSIGWDAKPDKEEVEQLITGDIPSINYVPVSVIEYRVDEDGNMTVTKVIVEDKVVYSSGI